ncbi:MAG TPA: response regulator [Thermoanaerobaculia bacterium]|nr:response regulator [Thermoanaerobaculia bacterium]
MRVLIVDDETAITEGLVALFELEQIEAAGAEDREAAEALIKESFFPVILADLRLKTEAEGIRLLESIQRLSPQSKVASLTAFATPEVEARLLSLGSSIVLRKPMEFEEIIAVVREMLDAIETEAAAQQARTQQPVDLVQLYTDVQRILFAIPQRRFGFSSDETEELVQEAWCLYLEKAQGIRTPKAWLAGTIANLCRQEIHHLTRKRENQRELSDGDEFCGSDGRNEDARLMVKSGLEMLDERGRQLCVLIGIEGFSYEEVSARLELPIGSVGPLYIRAKQRLRKAIESMN